MVFYLLLYVWVIVLDVLCCVWVIFDDLDGIEVYDCFIFSEYLVIDYIGLIGFGEFWKVIENGEIEIGGWLFINFSGGLIGGGYLVGVFGVWMLFDVVK